VIEKVYAKGTEFVDVDGKICRVIKIGKREGRRDGQQRYTVMNPGGRLRWSVTDRYITDRLNGITQSHHK